MTIFIGQDFWHRLTGDKNFYISLVGIFVEIFENENYSGSLDDAIRALSGQIEGKYFTGGVFDPGKL